MTQLFQKAIVIRLPVSEYEQLRREVLRRDGCDVSHADQ